MLTPETVEQVKSLIETYEKLIKVQNDVIREKEERIVLLKRYIDIQELEKEVDAQANLKGLNICLN
jgi:hypothetical protein